MFIISVVGFFRLILYKVLLVLLVVFIIYKFLFCRCLSVCDKLVIWISGIILVVLYVIFCMVLLRLVDLFLGIIIVCIFVLLVVCKYVFKLWGLVMLFNINNKGWFWFFKIWFKLVLFNIFVGFVCVIIFWCCLLFILLFNVLCW